jgi:hypothetical protein
VGVPAFSGRVLASSLRADNAAEAVDLARGVSLLPYEAVVISVGMFYGDFPGCSPAGAIKIWQILTEGVY